MTVLQCSVLGIIKCFQDYAGKDGDPKTLTKAELKELLQNELGELVGGAPDKAKLDSFFNDLDMNMDDRIDFTEFGAFVFSLIVMCHELFTKKK